MKYTRYIIAAVAGLIIVTIFTVFIGYLLALRPIDRAGGTTQDFTLASGTGVKQLAAELKEAGLIRSTGAFEWYVTLHAQRTKLQAGAYEFTTGDSVAKIADKISHGRVSVNRLTIPEGSDIADIRKLAVKKGLTADALNAALKLKYTNSFLDGKLSDLDLEGYLFPDTYNLTHPPSAQKLIQSMLDNFGKSIATADITQGLSAQGLTLHQGVTLASIVQKEAGSPPEQPMIASVFYNRLKAGMTLGSDVTVIYAADMLHVPFSTTLNSPYNSYTNKGLPPGPICSPGVTAMQAVAHPAHSDYLYFIADKQGKVHYARTAAEHQANVDKYLK